MRVIRVRSPPRGSLGLGSRLEGVGQLVMLTMAQKTHIVGKKRLGVHTPGDVRGSVVNKCNKGTFLHKLSTNHKYYYYFDAFFAFLTRILTNSAGVLAIPNPDQPPLRASLPVRAFLLVKLDIINYFYACAVPLFSLMPLLQSSIPIGLTFSSFFQ